MNKHAFIMLIALITIFSFNEAKSLCQPGFSCCRMSTVSYNGCFYNILFCYRNNNGVLEYQIDEINILLNQNCNQLTLVNSASSLAFWNYISEKVRLDLLDFYQYPFPNCPSTLVSVKQFYSTCWALVNDGANQQASLINCNSSIIYSCLTEYSYCRDQYGNLQQSIRTFAPAPDACSQIPFPGQLPPLGKTWEDNWTSTCMFTICQ